MGWCGLRAGSLVVLFGSDSSYGFLPGIHPFECFDRVRAAGMARATTMRMGTFPAYANQLRYR